MNNEIAKETYTYGLLPLINTVIFPHTDVNLDVVREASDRLIQKAVQDDEPLVLLTEKEDVADKSDNSAYYPIGVVARIEKYDSIAGEGKSAVSRIRVKALYRVKLVQIVQDGEHFKAEVEAYGNQEPDKDVLAAYERMLPEELRHYAQLSGSLDVSSILQIAEEPDPEARVDKLANFLFGDLKARYDFLALENVTDRYLALYSATRTEIAYRQLDRQIDKRVAEEVEQQQKEYYLHEKIRVISEELGDYQDPTELVDDYVEKIEALKAPEKTKERFIKEAKRLRKIPPVSPDYSVLQSYLDFVLDLPWETYSEHDIDINKAERVLDEDHYGLKDVKDRILEFLAVEQLRGSSQGSILCLVGPPGVGKTSLATSVARAMDREFIRMSLGGLEDESEIRGHRRTYVGAMPGRILRGIQTMETSNPVFLLDEIDKMSRNFRGDPAAALLEVLDPAQNDTFSDHYLEAPYDLSQVLFITTANDMSGIPGPLLDRLEVIQLPSYTEYEKLEIAKEYLVPRQIEKHGIEPYGPIHFSDGALLKIIHAYTRESGVRELERLIGRIARKLAREFLQNGKSEKGMRITVQNVDRYLDNPTIENFVGKEDNEVGVAVGLAWTQVGGDVLPVECQAVPGTGKIMLTGSLGDVMKESAHLTMGYLRSIWQALGKEERFAQEIDMHLHVPAGAVPKEGPSAGITIATAMASALTDKKVRKDTAMTGEMTLRGKVLPVGGIRDKVIAAHRAGCKRVILPKDNERDWKDVPESVQKALDVFYVDTVAEVFELAFEEGFHETPKRNVP